MPKFRGNSDDWLDSEGGGDSPSGRRNKRKARATDLSLEEANAVVVEVFPNQCRVKLASGEADLLCSYRRAEVIGRSEVKERTPVAVGDRVLVKQTGNSSGVIEGRSMRKNRLSRPAPGRDSSSFQHVLAANIDLLVIVTSVREPEFSTGLVDRFIIAAEAEKIPILICVTKIDLKGSVENPWQIYRDLNYPVIEVSTHQSVGIAELSNYLVNSPDQLESKTVAFCGQSGVGKTSLLRVLLGSEIGRVGSVNQVTGKGRHTTTGAVLFNGLNHGLWIDTPGIREFGLSQVTPENLATFYPEFQSLPCTRDYCTHFDELGCHARELPRYSNYRRIFESLKSGEN